MKFGNVVLYRKNNQRYLVLDVDDFLKVVQVVSRTGIVTD